MTKLRALLALFAFSIAAISPARAAMTTQDAPAAALLLRLSDSLQSLQQPTGEWIGAIEGDPSADFMPLILAKKLGLSAPGLKEQTLNRVFRWQDPATGLWPAYPGGPPSADVTAMVLNGLKFADIREDDPRVSRAWKWYRENGGINGLGTLNRMIALFAGIVPPESVPDLSPKFFALRKSSPVNIFNIGFGRSALIPMIVWKYYVDAGDGVIRKPRPLDPARIRSAGAAFGHVLDAPIELGDALYRLFHLGNEPTHGFLSDAMAVAEDGIPTSADFWAQEGIGWILKHQQADGTWAGALQVTYFCMFALHEAQMQGVGNFDSRIQAAWKGILAWRTEIPNGATIQQTTIGPVMDTARVLTAFAAAPARFQSLSPDRRRLATNWLVGMQINKPGDWSALAGQIPPGGWAFEYFNDFYPDSDDTGMVIEALAESEDLLDKSAETAIEKGTRWLLGMQNSDGGFPTWDRNTSKLFDWITENGISKIPDVSDISQGDITARVIKGLVAQPDHPSVASAVKRACEFLVNKRVKTKDTSLPLWRGEWMTDYAYGTAQALDALLIAKCWDSAEATPDIQWLISKQNPDGGWGESPESYHLEKFVAAPSTLTQTEFILNTLIRYELTRHSEGANDTWDAARFSIEAGIKYLIDRIGEDRFPHEDQFTGVYVRGVWYGRYLLLPHYEAVRVLGAYLSLVEEDGPRFEISGKSESSLQLPAGN